MNKVYTKVYKHDSGRWFATVYRSGFWCPIAKCRTRLGAIYQLYKYKKFHINDMTFVDL